MISSRSMRVLIAGVAVFGLVHSGAAFAETGLNLVLGQKLLDADEWGSIDEHDALGIELTWGREDWPFMIATDVLYSTTDETISGTDIEGTTTELDLGVRKTWIRGNARPYIGGGFAFIQGEVTQTGQPDFDDSEVGGWVGGGIYWRFGSRFNVGVALRYSSAEVDFPGGDLDLGGQTFGLLLGWGWLSR